MLPSEIDVVPSHEELDGVAWFKSIESRSSYKKSHKDNGCLFHGILKVPKKLDIPVTAHIGFTFIIYATISEQYNLSSA